MATTKIKKVETPIDERETFVSLQKSFADSEANIQEKLKTLYALQEADNEIEKIVQLRGELPAEVEALEGDVAAIEGKIAHVNALIEEYLRNIDLNKQNIVDYDAQIEKYREQLENISNSREYDSINKELENQDLLRQIAVKNIGETRMAIEEKRDLLEELGRRLEIRQEDLAAKQEELSVIKDSTAAEEEKLQARRDSLAAKIDARTMSAYTRIRQSVHNHLAVVPVFNGDSCGGCFNTVTPQRLIEIASGRKLVICEHCGRIIVNPDAE
ncbi:MAG: hypothetical protein IJ654_03660 [Bacteroidales bacterium]|nr:hypothetical protein [Bacteroidales bacterium]